MFMLFFKTMLFILYNKKFLLSIIVLDKKRLSHSNAEIAVLFCAEELSPLFDYFIKDAFEFEPLAFSVPVKQEPLFVFVVLSV